MIKEEKTLDPLNQSPIKLSGSSVDLIEAGDMGRSMGKQYLKELDDMKTSHANLKGIYYILVNHYQQAPTPRNQYLCFCSMREKPQAILGCDLWRMNNENDKCDLVWTLPHRESWNQIKQSIYTDKFLRECMTKFDEGTL